MNAPANDLFHLKKNYPDEIGTLWTIPVLWRSDDIKEAEKDASPYVHVSVLNLANSGRRWHYTLRATIANHQDIPESQIVALSANSFLSALCQVEIGGSFFRPASSKIPLNEYSPDVPWSIEGTILVEEKKIKEMKLYRDWWDMKILNAMRDAREIRIAQQSEKAESIDNKFLIGYSGKIPTEKQVFWNTLTYRNAMISGGSKPRRTHMICHIIDAALKSGHAVTHISDDLPEKKFFSSFNYLQRIARREKIDIGKVNRIYDESDAVLYLREVRHARIASNDNGEKRPLELIVIDDCLTNTSIRKSVKQIADFAIPKCNILATQGDDLKIFTPDMDKKFDLAIKLSGSNDSQIGDNFTEAEVKIGNRVQTLTRVKSCTEDD